jgi:hypothetical protein
MYDKLTIDHVIKYSFCHGLTTVQPNFNVVPVPVGSKMTPLFFNIGEGYVQAYVAGSGTRRIVGEVEMGIWRRI